MRTKAFSPPEETRGAAGDGSSAAETLKVILSGMLALSFSVAAASLFSQLNSGRFLPFLFITAACVATVFIGSIGWAALLHAFGGGPHGAVVFLGLTLPLASWFLIHFNHEYWLLGPAALDVPVSEAGEHRYASLFRFTDARVATEFRGVKSVSSGGGRGHRPSTEWYYVAPVVPEDWRPGQPVTAWAAAPVNQFYTSHANWSKPHRAGVRLASYELRYYREAAADAEETHGLVSAEGAPFIRWTAAPEAELERARLFVLWVIAGNNLLLLLLLAAGSVITRLRWSNRRSFPDPRRKWPGPRRLPRQRFNSAPLGPPARGEPESGPREDMESPPRHS